MPLASNQLLNKITTLKTSLQSGLTITNKKSTPTYSEQMVAATIHWCTAVEEHNDDIQFWKKNASQFAEFLSLLDHSSGTFVPSVFNQQSVTLAQMIYDVINGIEDADLLLFDGKLLGRAFSYYLGENKSKFFTQIAASLKGQIEFYRVCQKSTQADTHYIAIVEKINDLIKNLRTQDVTKDNYADFIEQYKKFAQFAIGCTRLLPYICILNAEHFINLSSPAAIKSEVNSTGMQPSRLSLISTLVYNYEADTINRQLTKKSLPSVNHLNQYYLHCMHNTQPRQDIEAKFTQFINNFRTSVERYAQGLSWRNHESSDKRNRPNARKTQLLTALKDILNTYQYSTAIALPKLEGIAEYLPKETLSVRTFAAFKLICKAISDHNTLVSQHTSIFARLSLGETNKLLHSYMKQACDLFMQCDERHDIDLQKRLLKISLQTNSNQNKSGIDANYTPYCKSLSSLQEATTLTDVMASIVNPDNNHQLPL